MEVLFIWYDQPIGFLSLAVAYQQPARAARQIQAWRAADASVWSARRARCATRVFAVPLPRWPAARGRGVRRPARPRRGRCASPADRLSCPCSRGKAPRLAPPGRSAMSAPQSRIRSRFQRRESAEARIAHLRRRLPRRGSTPADHATTRGQRHRRWRGGDHLALLAAPTGPLPRRPGARGRAVRRPAKPRRWRCGSPAERHLSLVIAVVAAKHPRWRRGQIGHVRAPLVQDQIQAGARSVPARLEGRDARVAAGDFEGDCAGGEGLLQLANP
jgi:hypothetical protein